jgi:hypothetical protein
MDVKRWRWPPERRGRLGRRKPEELAARLAPLEETEAFRKSEQADAGKRAEDTIRVDNTTIKMPEYLGEEERDVESTFRLDPAVAVITIVALAFIAFVAWQISQMPPK